VTDIGDRSAILHNAREFFWYKHHLDDEGKHLHIHRGEPERYPCMVYSRWKMDYEVLGGQVYEHTFVAEPQPRSEEPEDIL